MKTLWRFLIAFLAITGAVALATAFLEIPFGRDDFWDHHGVIFLLFLTTFPRLTLLFSSVATGGFFWWLGWLFAPHLLVAVLATFAYWNQNPVLVVIAWLVAFSGESSEKYVAIRRARVRRGRTPGFDSARWVKAEVENPRR